MAPERVKRACTWCKRRKVKCDGQSPCKNCKIHQHLCEYPRMGEETLTLSRPYQARKPHSEEYVKYLENRVHELEQKLAGTDQSIDIDSAFAHNGYICSPRKHDILTKHHSIFPRELAKSLVKGIEPEQRKDIAIPRIQFYGWNMSGEYYLKSRPLPPLEPVLDLLVEDFDFAQWLLKFYFRSLNPLFSVVHEPVFQEQYSKYVLELQDVSSEAETRLFNSMLYLVFAISVRFARAYPDVPESIRLKLEPELEQSLFQGAYDVIQRLSFEWYSLELIQSWILITFYLRATHRQFASYASLGTAIRMSKSMTLNLDVANENLALSKNEYLNSTRVFWLVYTWDKLYAYQCGKQYDIRDDWISVPFPEYSASVLEYSIDLPALAMIHLARIAGYIMAHFTKSADLDRDFLDQIRPKLDEWRIWWDGIPKDELDPLIVHQVHLTYLDINLSMYNKILYKYLDRDGVFGDTHSHILELVKYSSEALDVFYDIKEKELHFVKWWLNLSLLFNVAIISIALMNCGIKTEQSAKHLKLALDLLSSVQDKATMARECVWAIKMLNHITVLRFNSTSKVLSEIGLDHGPSTVNKKNFLQFGRIGDPDTTTEIQLEDPQFDHDQAETNHELLSNLRWFDQWIKDIL